MHSHSVLSYCIESILVTVLQRKRTNRMWVVGSGESWLEGQQETEPEWSGAPGRGHQTLFCSPRESALGFLSEDGWS